MTYIFTNNAETLKQLDTLIQEYTAICNTKLAESTAYKKLCGTQNYVLTQHIELLSSQYLYLEILLNLKELKGCYTLNEEKFKTLTDDFSKTNDPELINFLKTNFTPPKIDVKKERLLKKQLYKGYAAGQLPENFRKQAMINAASQYPRFINQFSLSLTAPCNRPSNIENDELIRILYCHETPGL